jgi:hypothetical protein
MTRWKIGYSLATVGPKNHHTARKRKGRNLLWLRPLCLVGATGLEPVTPSVSSKGTSDASETGKGVMEGAPSACTPACTSKGSTGQADPVAVLAAALLGLSPEDRARLAALLLHQPNDLMREEGGKP